MRKLLFVVLAIGVIIFVVPQFKSETIKIFSYSECDTPIPYKLGTLDSKFGLDQTSAVVDIQNAVDVWNNSYGKRLFVNSSTSVLTVNFVYDQRSALNSNIDKLQNQLDQENTTLQQKIGSYEADSAAFEQKLANFNAQVDQINRSGGASRDLYNSLISQQNELHTEGESLNNRAGELNLTSRDYNSQVRDLNQNINQFSQAISQKPEEGLYDGNNNTITIYFADNQQQLIHTLAHEFGHALGMQHTDDPAAIMYLYTTPSLLVTPQDKQQLTFVCREQLLFNLWMQELVHSLKINT